MEHKRVTIFMGHYGSGKTNVAVNYALNLKKTTNKMVSVYDMDIVNPYFRTLNSKKTLEENDINLVASNYANTNVDLPAMNAECYKILDKNLGFAILDIGGDDRGALALGRFVEKLKLENDVEVLYVVNKYRYETRTPKDAVEIFNEIELASKIKFTGIVNNSNLGVETTKSTILNSFEYVNEISKMVNLPIKFTAVRSDIESDALNNVGELLKMEIIDYKSY